MKIGVKELDIQLLTLLSSFLNCNSGVRKLRPADQLRPKKDKSVARKQIIIYKEIQEHLKNP